jgi:hypothetical protein
MYFYLWVDQNQGDQIGRIFACWVSVNFGHFFENYRSIPIFGGFFLHGKSYVFVLRKKWVGPLWAIFSQTRLTPLFKIIFSLKWP